MRPPAPRLLFFAAAFLAVAIVAPLLWAQIAHRAPPPCVTRSFEGSHFTVCAFEADHHEVRLASRGDDGGYLRSFRALNTALGDDAARVRFAMNGGMFNDDGAPIGLYVQDGGRVHRLNLANGPGNFHMKPNGVFWQGDDGDVHVDTSEAFAAATPHPHWATQSGPMLVIDGALHAQFAPDGPSRYIRNGVGVRNARNALFVISAEPVSFGKFARFFRDALHCPNALFLDGSISSLWAPSIGREDRGHPLGPLIVVLDPSHASP